MPYHQLSFAPKNPVARFFAVIAGLGVFALILFLGVIFLAAFVALGALAWVYFQVRRWWLGRGEDKRPGDDNVVDVEYRVVERDDKRP